MSKVAVFLAEGFEEIEALTVVDYLRRAEIEVTMLAVGTKREVTGSHAITVVADAQLESVDTDMYDALVLPGGLPGATHLSEDSKVQAAIQSQHQRGEIVAAICAAPLALQAAGLLKGRRFTSYPGDVQAKLEAEGEYVESKVVWDQNILTSRGPATAVYFALELIERLKGKETRDKIAQGLLMTWVEQN